MEEGAATTPFDMVVMSGMSRYHLAAEALRRVPRPYAQASALIEECNNLIARATAYSHEHLEDPPEITNWVWPHSVLPDPGWCPARLVAALARALTRPLAGPLA